MSSHHIIREKQEPALIIWDLDQIDQEYLGQVLEWSPTIVGLENSIDTILSLGIKLDIAVISKERTSEWHKKLSDQHPIEIISSQSPEAAVPMVLEELIKKEYNAVNIVGNRIALEDYKKWLVTFNDLLDLVMINALFRYFQPKMIRFEKWYASSIKIDIVPLKGNSCIHTTGFVSNLDHEKILEPITLGTAIDGIVCIQSDDPSYLIAERIH